MKEAFTEFEPAYDDYELYDGKSSSHDRLKLGISASVDSIHAGLPGGGMRGSASARRLEPYHDTANRGHGLPPLSMSVPRRMAKDDAPVLLKRSQGTTEAAGFQRRTRLPDNVSRALDRGLGSAGRIARKHLVSGFDDVDTHNLPSARHDGVAVRLQHAKGTSTAFPPASSRDSKEGHAIGGSEPRKPHREHKVPAVEEQVSAVGVQYTLSAASLSKQFRSLVGAARTGRDGLAGVLGGSVSPLRFTGSTERSLQSPLASDLAQLGPVSSSLSSAGVSRRLGAVMRHQSELLARVATDIAIAGPRAAFGDLVSRRGRWQGQGQGQVRGSTGAGAGKRTVQSRSQSPIQRTIGSVVQRARSHDDAGLGYPGVGIAMVSKTSDASVGFGFGGDSVGSTGSW